MSSLRALLLSICVAAPAFAGIISAEAPVTTPALLPTGATYYGLTAGANGAYVAWSNSPYVFGMRLNADGTPNVATRKLLATDAAYASPTVYAVDDSFYVAYLPKDSTTIRVLRVDGGVDVRLPYSNVKMAWNGSRFLAIDADTVSVYGTLYDKNFNVVVPRTTIRNFDYLVFLSSAGGKFLVGTTPRNSNIGGAPLKLTGTVIDNDGKSSTVPLPDYSYTYGASVATNGAEYLLVWQTEPLHVLAQHLSPSGAPASDLFAVASRNSVGLLSAAAAWSGTDYIVTWGVGDYSTANARNYAHVRGTTASDAIPAPSINLGLLSSPNGVFGLYGNGVYPVIQRLDVADTPHALILSGTTQSAIDIASADLSTTGVLWREADGTHFGRLDASGKPLDGNGIVVAGLYEDVKLFAGPLDFLVVRNYGSIRAQLISRDGTLVGPVKTLFTQNTNAYITSFDATWSGSSFTILWSTTAGIDGAVMLPTGEVGGTVPPYALGPVVVAAGSPPLAVFGTGTIRGKFLDPTLSFPMQSGGALQPIAIATSGRDYLVLTAKANGANAYDIAATRFDIHGALIDGPMTLMNAAQVYYGQYGQVNIGDVDVVWDGNNYRASWLDASQHLVVATIDHAQLLCNCITSTVVVPVPTAVANPKIASPGGGRLLVLYDRPVSDPWFGAQERAFVRDLDVAWHHAAGR